MVEWACSLTEKEIDFYTARQRQVIITLSACAVPFAADRSLPRFLRQGIAGCRLNYLGAARDGKTIQVTHFGIARFGLEIAEECNTNGFAPITVFAT